MYANSRTFLLILGTNLVQVDVINVSLLDNVIDFRNYCRLLDRTRNFNNICVKNEILDFRIK